MKKYIEFIITFIITIAASSFAYYYTMSIYATVAASISTILLTTAIVWTFRKMNLIGDINEHTKHIEYLLSVFKDDKVETMIEFVKQHLAITKNIKDASEQHKDIVKEKFIDFPGRYYKITNNCIEYIPHMYFTHNLWINFTRKSEEYLSIQRLTGPDLKFYLLDDSRVRKEIEQIKSIAYSTRIKKIFICDIENEDIKKYLKRWYDLIEGKNIDIKYISEGDIPSDLSGIKLEDCAIFDGCYCIQNTSVTFNNNEIEELTFSINYDKGILDKQKANFLTLFNAKDASKIKDLCQNNKK